MNSRLYDCRIYHSRSEPKTHKFSYRIFMFCIDLDETEKLEKNLRLIGKSNWAPYQLRTSDHYDAGKSSIKENILSYLETMGYMRDHIGSISLLTHLRTFGHVFNPVSFYFVKDVFGNQLCSIAEVDNTFNEQKLFLIEQNQKGRYKQSLRKLFYVSPYSDLDTTFHFNLKEPENELRLGINQSATPNDKPFFRSGLSGKAIKLTDKNLALYSLRFPAITIGILIGIHWQALLLFLKGHRARPKAEKPELQTKKHVYLKPHQHATH